MPPSNVPERHDVCTICGAAYLSRKYWQKKQKKAVWQKACSPECRTALRKSIHGSSHYLWKGNDICYSTVHNWVRKHYPAPMCCEKCGSERPLDAANISGEYKRKKSDWLYLCHSCHVAFDSNRHKRDENGKFTKCAPIQITTSTRLQCIQSWNSREQGRIAKVKRHNSFVLNSINSI